MTHITIVFLKKKRQTNPLELTPKKLKLKP